MVPIERIETRILLVRSHKILLDADLADLYGVSTGRFNEAVRRNRARFPADFMFQLNDAEYSALRSQIAISNSSRGGRRYPPYAFTEHGAIMAATLLNSHRAIEVSVYVVRAFVRLRQFLATHKDLAQRLAVHEKKLANQDRAIASLVDAIRTLMAPAETAKRRPIGFVTTDDKKRG